MDPISVIGLAASVAQLAGIAKQTFSTVFQYLEDVKDAPERSRELRGELLTVTDLIQSLEEILNRSPPKSSFTPPPSLTSAIPEFKDMLETMQTRVTEAKTKGVKRLKWPFTKEQNERYLTRIGRYKDTFNLALSIKGL
jgi:hypothetical protein